MSGPCAQQVVLCPALRAQLASLVRSQSAPQALARRARIVLLAAEGLGNAKIAHLVGADVKTVRLWRGRFAATPRLEALFDRHRSGRPATVSAQTRAKLVSLACERPEADDRRPFRDVWSHRALQTALADATGVRLSTSEIGRILRARELRPHRVRMWLNSQDPDFGPKIDRVCKLYTNPPQGVTVLCVDEKRLFAHLRTPGLQPAKPGRSCRKEFEYSRHGSSVLLAAFDIQTGKVFAQCRERRTGDDLVDFMESVARSIEGQVVIIWDNLNVHHDGKGQRWTRFNERHGGRFTFVHTPKHASWTNQVEIWFSILERRVLRHGSFATVAAVNVRTTGFITHWNAHEAAPFRWTFRGTRDLKPRSGLGANARTPHRFLASKRPRAKAA